MGSLLRVLWHGSRLPRNRCVLSPAAHAGEGVAPRRFCCAAIGTAPG